MRKWKYFNLRDDKKEALGVVNSSDEKGAYILASKIKNLPISLFRKLFRLEKL
jgi:hypothetical protein